jgi:hypothetical protein
MAPPHIGIKAAYLHYVFATCPAPVKANRVKPAQPPARYGEPRVYKPERPWEPKTGLAWKPGLPTHRESMEIIQEIFSRPCSNAGIKRSVDGGIHA